MGDLLHKNSTASGRIISNREIAKDHFLMSLKVSSAESSFKEASPGQFVMLRVKGRKFPFLGRPLSIYSIYQDNGGFIVEFLYRVVGEGTYVISRLKPDEEMYIMGPLGRGFDISPDHSCIILIAGGIGIAPLSFLGEHYRRYAAGRPQKIICYAGVQKANLLVGLEGMEEICSGVRISTDDGSRGYHGLVTELFKNDLNSYSHRDSIIYACGPSAMLKGLAGILKDQSIPCQVSVEERMACGVGACLGCAVRVKSGYKRVCKDGPVFDMKEIDWE